MLIAGPLTRLGMDDAGTLQEVRAFMALVADVRKRSGRLLTVVLVHHENKGGAVSGAWEGAGDTLLHVQAAGNGHTIVFVQKARWDNERHGKTLQLAWADGEGFVLEGDRNYLVEIVELLSDGKWRTLKEIARSKDKGGIGANDDTVRELLDKNPEQFVSANGKAIGRAATATVWQLRHDTDPELHQSPDAVDAVSASQGGAEATAAPAASLKGAAVAERTPAAPLATALDAGCSSSQLDVDAEFERAAAKLRAEESDA